VRGKGFGSYKGIIMFGIAIYWRAEDV